jgi:hypothetical protein
MPVMNFGNWHWTKSTVCALLFRRSARITNGSRRLRRAAPHVATAQRFLQT